MTDKKKLHQILSSLWKNDDSVGKTYYNQALQDVQTAIDLQEEPVSEDLEEAAKRYSDNENPICTCEECLLKSFKIGAKWQKENLWKPADGDDLPILDREVIALTQPYTNDEHLRVVFAHRPSKYAKFWNSDLGEEQVVEIEGYDKGGWNIPNVKYWLNVELPKEIEL